MGEGEKAEVGEWMELEEEGRTADFSPLGWVEVVGRTKVCGPKGRGTVRPCVPGRMGEGAGD